MNILTPFLFDPQQQYLFKRAYQVAIGAPFQTSALAYGTVGKNPAPLRIAFDIDKNMAGTSNKSKVSIYNMSIQSRQAIKKGYIINLQAGYNGLMETLFLGNIITPISKMNGAEVVTEMECGDGESSIVMARLDKSYPAGVSLATILQDVGNAMKVTDSTNPVGTNAGIALGIPNVTYSKGFVAHGACRETLNKLLQPQGLEWNIQNGNLNIIPIKAHNGSTAIVVASGVTSSIDATGKGTTTFNPAQATGLIGVPSQNEYFTQFTCLLNPRLVPGALVKLVSENTALNGFYKLRRCHYEGDSHDTKWQVSCEATIQPGVVQTLPAARGFDYNTAVV